jgi:Ni,Fe-hydrogenase I cytochrome b subunit
LIYKFLKGIPSFLAAILIVTLVNTAFNIAYPYVAPGNSSPAPYALTNDCQD